MQQALTHRSHGSRHNERLEFLGDGLLNFVVADWLYHARPGAPEGDLSRLRARIVRDTTLAELGSELGLGDHLHLGPGELKSGGFLRASILADAVEAVMGAVFLDAGFEAARAMVLELLAPRLESLPPADSLKDPKTRLQEALQARGLPLPEYRLLSESGADHQKCFRVACQAALSDTAFEAEAESRRKAEQKAARLMLQALAERGLNV